MIETRCDRCNATLTFPEDQAGRKVPCPHCGDINRLPGEPATDAPAPARADRAAAAGLPPDQGPEQRVRLVRPAMFRARPVLGALLVLATLAGAAGVVYFAWIAPLMWAAWVSAVALAVGIVWLGVWKVITLAAALEITTKRTIEHRGLLSRATSEVLHDNIRNIQVSQTFWQRIWNVGSIGISSSGQDGIEVNMGGVPRPRDLQRVIDLYRPL